LHTYYLRDYVSNSFIINVRNVISRQLYWLHTAVVIIVKRCYYWRKNHIVQFNYLKIIKNIVFNNVKDSTNTILNHKSHFIIESIVLIMIVSYHLRRQKVHYQLVIIHRIINQCINYWLCHVLVKNLMYFVKLFWIMKNIM